VNKYFSRRKMMNKEEIKSKIYAVQQALDNMTVSGIQNMSILVGCHNVLQDALNECDNEEVVVKPEEE
jgi:hypothetical protein